MKWSDDEVGVELFECPGCEGLFPISHFWPIQGKSGRNSGAMKYHGRWSICRRCASSQPSSEHIIADPWEEPVPARKTLRERVSERKGEVADG